MPRRESESIREQVQRTNKDSQLKSDLQNKQPHISPQRHSVGDHVGRDGSISLRIINNEPFFTGRVKGKWYYRKMLPSATDVAGEIDQYVTTVKKLTVTDPSGLDHDSLGGLVGSTAHDERYYTETELITDGVLDWDASPTGRYMDKTELDIIFADIDAAIAAASDHDPPSGGDGIDVTDIGAFNEISVDLHGTPGLEFSSALLKAKVHTANATKLQLTSSGIGIQPSLAPTWTGTHKWWAASAGVKNIQSDHWVWDTTGWAMTYGGSLDVRYINADELHVKAFIADLEQALANGQIIAKSVVILAQDFYTPGGSSTITVEGLPGWLAADVFAVNDYIRVRSVNRTSYENTDIKGLDVHDTWYQIGSKVSNVDGIQVWNITWKDGGTGFLVNKGGVVIDYGVSGDGYYQVTAAKETGDFDTVPFARVATWTTNPWTGGNHTTRAKMGNLKAETSIKEWGFYFYKQSKVWGKLGSGGGELHGVELKFYDGSNERIRISATSGYNIPTIKVGDTSLSSMTYGVGKGIFMGKDSAVYKFRVGDPASAYFGYDGIDLIFQTGASGDRITMDGDDARMSWWDAGTEAIRIDSNTYATYPGIWLKKSNARMLIGTAITGQDNILIENDKINMLDAGVNKASTWQYNSFNVHGHGTFGGDPDTWSTNQNLGGISSTTRLVLLDTDDANLNFTIDVSSTYARMTWGGVYANGNWRHGTKAGTNRVAWQLKHISTGQQMEWWASNAFGNEDDIITWAKEIEFYAGSGDTIRLNQTLAQNAFFSEGHQYVGSGNISFADACVMIDGKITKSSKPYQKNVVGLAFYKVRTRQRKHGFSIDREYRDSLLNYYIELI